MVRGYFGHGPVVRFGLRAYRPFRRYYGRRWPWLQGGGWSQGPASSSLVAWAQSCLATIFGPVVPQDGVFGPETRGFVQQFQAQQGLPTTGDLDQATVSALQAAVSRGAVVSSPSQPAPPPSTFVVPPLSPGAPAPAPVASGHWTPHHHPHRGAPWFSSPPPLEGGHPGAAPRRDATAPASPAAPATSPAAPAASPHPSSELSEIAAGWSEPVERGRWMRINGRIFLIGA
jgi:peptidoglycan hydrolase-like protein with peptidoglycan-binding domain